MKQTIENKDNEYLLKAGEIDNKPQIIDTLTNSSHINDNEIGIVFEKKYDEAYRNNYWNKYKEFSTKNHDIDTDVEQNIDSLIETNIIPGSEQTILIDLVNKHPECQIIINQEKDSSPATILKRFNLNGFKAEDLIKYLRIKYYPKFQNTYERVCLRPPIFALQEFNIEYFVYNRMSKFPELKRNDLKFKDYLPSSRLREIKSQYFINVFVKKHPELNAVADRFKEWDPSDRLREVSAQYAVNAWIKAHPEFQKIADDRKELPPSVVNKFMKFN